MIRKVIGVLACVWLLTGANAFADNATCGYSCGSSLQSGDFCYVEVDGGASITTYIGSETDMIIPEQIEGLPVVSIGQTAFMGCTALTSVVIPDSVTTIGDAAFYLCSGLISVSAGKGVTNLYEVFSVDLPNLVSMDVDVDNANYSSLDGVVYNKDFTQLIYYPDAKPGEEFAIPDSVTMFNGRVFGGCSNLISLTINANADIYRHPWWDYGFFSGPSLTTINVAPNNENFTSLDGVLYSKDLTELWGYPRGKTYEEFTIPDSVTRIKGESFRLSNLSRVTIPDGVTSIGEGAFYECDSLTSIIIPASVTSIGDSAFEWCSSLSTAYFLGNAPSFHWVETVFQWCAPDFKVCHKPGATGFTTMDFFVYPAVVCICSDGSLCAADEVCVDPVCESDSDSDGVADIEDNCPDIANAYQADLDNDGIGDVCDQEPYFLWRTQVQNWRGDWVSVEDYRVYQGDLTFSHGTSGAILWTTVDPDSPDHDLGWPSRRGVVHSYVSYRAVGQQDWSAETEAAWFSAPAGFASMWSWIYPASYIGVNGLYEIKLISEDAAGFRCEEVHAIEIK